MQRGREEYKGTEWDVDSPRDPEVGIEKAESRDKGRARTQDEGEV